MTRCMSAPFRPRLPTRHTRCRRAVVLDNADNLGPGQPHFGTQHMIIFGPCVGDAEGYGRPARPASRRSAAREDAVRGRPGKKETAAAYNEMIPEARHRLDCQALVLQIGKHSSELPSRG